MSQKLQRNHDGDRVDQGIVFGNQKDVVGDVGDLCFKAWLATFEKTLAKFAQLPRIVFGAMFENTLASLEGEVQAGKIGVLRFELVNDAE